MKETVFQFTLPCRERPPIGAVAVAFGAFQFTLPCRERQGWNKVSWEWRLIPCSARSIAQIELSKIGNGGGDFCCL